MRVLMSATTRVVEELQHDEHRQAIINIGGVLKGERIKPYATSMEHKIPQM
jgi:hypothetical protein